MPKTSNIKKVRADIVFIKITLDSMTFSEFISLPISRIRHLSNLLEAAKSDEKFAKTFPKHVALDNRSLVCSPAKCETVEIYMKKCYQSDNDYIDAYTNWCCTKLRQRIENCAYKIRQMLEGTAFDNTEISTARMRTYQGLYDVVSDSGESLEGRRIARAVAQAHKQ